MKPSNMNVYVESIRAIHDRAFPAENAHDEWQKASDWIYLRDRIEQDGTAAALRVLASWIEDSK